MTHRHLPSLNHLRILYICALGSLGTQIAFLPLALLDSGLTHTEVSLLLALLPLVRMAAPPIWSFLADRYQITSSLLRITFWGSFLFYLPILSGSWLTAAIFLSLYCFFWTPVRVLTDALAFQKIAHDGGNYGEIRFWGTFAYIAVTLLSGIFASVIGVKAVVLSGAALLLLGAFFSHGLPASPPRLPQKLGPAFRHLTHQPGFLLFIVSIILHAIGQTAYDSVFPLHLRHLGFSEKTISFSVAIGATGEAIAMWFSHRVLMRFGILRVFAFGTALASIRWYLNATATSAGILLPLQSLHSITFALWWVAAATYLDQEAPRQIQASAQAILIFCSFGVGGFVAMLLSAGIGGQYGTSTLFLVCAALSVVAALCAAGAVFRREGSLRLSSR